MKSMSRIRPNIATKTAKSQALNGYGKPAMPAQNKVTPYQRRCLKEQRDRKFYLSVPGVGYFNLPENISAAVKRAASKKGVSTERLFSRCITNVKPMSDGEFVLPPGNEHHTSCLAVFCRLTGKPVCKVTLTDGEFNALMEKVTMQSQKLEDFVANAIRKAMAAPADDGFVNLELMVCRVQGLLQLLADKLELIRTDASEFSGKPAENLCAGVSLMVMDAQKQLREAFDNAFHAAHATFETKGNAA